MRKHGLKILFLVAAVLFVICPPSRVQAKVYDFSKLYMEITVPEDTVVLTKDTPVMDEQWSKAGITDPKAKKDEMNKMGAQAILYDPKTGMNVSLLQKQSNESQEVFHLSLLTEDELKEFLDGLITPDDDTTVHVEQYPQKEIPFFRISIEMMKDNVPMKEIIYGTVVNGYAISYDIYTENKTDPLEEDFIRGLVAGTHFTEFLDKAEMERQARNARIFMMVSVGALVVVIVLWVFIRKSRQKSQDALKKRKLEALEQFYKDKKLKEEQHITGSVLYVNRTRYTEEIIKNFFYYNEIYKRMKLWVISSVLFVLLFITLYQSDQALLSWFIAIAALFVIIYFQGSQIEKLIKNTVKSYGTWINKDVTATFYEDYFTVTGIQYNSSFPYVQITEVREYKEFFYLYLGINKIFYLKKDGFEQGEEEFGKFIEQKVFLK
jgi:hypothetical protein